MAGNSAVYSLALESDIVIIEIRHPSPATTPCSRHLGPQIALLEDINPSDFDHSEVLATVAAHGARWEQMTIHLFRSHNLIPLFRGPMPRLRHLDLAFWWESSEIESLEAPLLRTVALDGVDASMVHLPWVQITSLTLHFTNPAQWGPLLRLIPNLTHCCLNAYLEDDGFDKILPDVTLAYLQSLTLVDDPSESPILGVGYLGSFVVPVLRR